MSFTAEQFQTFLGTLPYPPNDFQLKVLESVAFGEGNIQVSAVAGSGKTTLITQIVSLIRYIEEHTRESQSSILPVAFNVTIRDELTKRLRPYNVEAINSNRLGNNAIHRWLESRGERKRSRGFFIQDIQDKKYPDLAKECLNTHLGRNYETTEIDPSTGKPVMRSTWSLSYTCARLAEICLLSFVKHDNPDAIQYLSEHHNMDWKQAQPHVIDAVIEDVIPDMLERGWKMWERERAIALCEQLTLPIIENMPLEQYDWVLGDEAQDWNVGQQALVARSLKPDGRIIIVGDFKQAIMGFAGSDAMSWFRMQKVFNAMVLDLNITYRCPSKVVDLARAIVPQIEARPNAPEGNLEQNLSLTDLFGRLEPDTLIMGRMNATVVAAFFDLIKEKARKHSDILIQVIGRDIANAITSMTGVLKKMPGFTWDEFEKYVDTYRADQMQRISRYRSPSRREEMEQELGDDIAVLMMCHRNFEADSIESFEAKAKEVFGGDTQEENNRIERREEYVSICTGHKAKGLEAKTAVILSPDEYMATREGQRAWQMEQERNLMYVGITRAKENLLVVKNPETLIGELAVVPTPFNAESAREAMERQRQQAIAAMDSNLIPGVDVDAILGIGEPKLVESEIVEQPVVEPAKPVEKPIQSALTLPESNPLAVSQEHLPIPSSLPPNPTLQSLKTTPLSDIGNSAPPAEQLQEVLMSMSMESLLGMSKLINLAIQLKAAESTADVKSA